MAEITIAVVPSATPGDDSGFVLDGLCVALTKLLDVPVSGINSRSYQDLAAELEKGRVDYAWMSPTLMLLTAEHIQLRPLLSAVRNGSTEYCSALFVDDAMPIDEIDDLHNSTVAWVDSTSASGYLFPRLMLAAQGKDPAHLFRKELFLRSHAEVVRAVLDGKADVGATYAQRPVEGEPVTRAGWLHVAPTRSVRVLEYSQPIPNDMIVGHGLIEKAHHTDFVNAILTLSNLENGKRLLYRAFHAEQFKATPRNALRPLEMLLQTARSHGLFSHL
ncbi:MAG TPA: PhnD/SsuA/transferrin family substrate-binding protein [Kofleriaceae bacterium]|nr:PhnD/SsuA/transferrin family substrate-binding protein [Kofleriaceae bacterium]